MKCSTFSLLLPLLSSLSFTSAAGTRTAIGPRASCLYSSVAPSSTAYAAEMNNNNLTVPAIQNFYGNFIFTCQAPENFTAYRIASFPLNPKPWFGAALYRPGAPCSVSFFQEIVGYAQKYQNSYGNDNVTCTPYANQGTSPFEAEAKKYFASLKR